MSRKRSATYKEAIVAWLWAEDQKAVAAQSRQVGQPEILVSV
jgi:hypothetical protein